MANATTLASAHESLELRRCAERIVGRVDEWLEKNGVFVPFDTARRRRNSRNWRQSVRALVGLFTPVALPDSPRLIVFEGLRDKRYHGLFDPREVVIIGSHTEREYAQANGFGFAWSYPMDGAVFLALSRGIRFFLMHQLRSWAQRLHAYEKVGIFLYEDTQPLGAYFANLAPLAGRHVKVICIQHGYFPKPRNDLPLDGSISEFNFLWDEKQAALIGCPPEKAFVIGPPAITTARATESPGIILVGTGTAHDGTGDYERTLAWYKSLLDLLPQDLHDRVWYRPHPNELVDPENAGRLRKLFPKLDVLPLAQRLAGEVAIFVGSFSSVLFEARYAGHRVVRVALRDDFIPMFERDAEFSADQIGATATWLEATCRSGQALPAASHPPPRIDFLAAAQEVLSHAA